MIIGQRKHFRANLKIMLCIYFLIFIISLKHGVYGEKFVEPLGCFTHYVEMQPKGTKIGEILLLHGERYTSSTWFDLGTLQVEKKQRTLMMRIRHFPHLFLFLQKVLAAAGFRAVAIDLPGHGKSHSRIDHESDADFMLSVLDELKLTRLS